MSELIGIFLGVVLILCAIAGVVSLVFTKGASIGRKDEEDIEQEKWIQEYERKNKWKKQRK